jgi:hypothetical protein
MANAGTDRELRHFDQLLATQVPEFLYHYTSSSGLYEIVKSDSIWASKIQYLNDSEEFVGATERCASLLREIAGRQTQTWPRELILFMAESLSRIDSVNICVCSFTEKSDLLSQWRGYCPPGGGYCLGIESKSLIEAFGSKKFTMLPCVYSWFHHDLLLKDAINNTLPGLLKIPSVPLDQLPQHAEPIVQIFFGLIHEIAPIIKHPGFAEEKEWRVNCSVTTTVMEPGPSKPFRTQGIFSKRSKSRTDNGISSAVYSRAYALWCSDLTSSRTHLE